MTLRTHRPRRAATLAFAVAALSSGLAAAASEGATELRLTLATPDGREPTHVCIVAEGFDRDLVPKQTRKLTALSSLICARGDEKCARAPDFVNHGEFVFTNPERAQPELEAAMNGDRLEPNNELLRSVKALSFDHNEHKCDYGATNCHPLFSLRGLDPNKAHITCAANKTLPADRTEERKQNRGLLLGLSALTEASLDNVQIVGLRLNGNQLIVRTGKVDKVDFIVRTLGGYYAPTGELRLSKQLDGTLAVEPRCQWTTIGIPPIASPKRAGDKEGGEFDATIELGFADEPARQASQMEQKGCVSGSLQDTELRLLIPYEPLHKKILKITGKDPDAPDAPHWQLEANWVGARPGSVEPSSSSGAPGYLKMGVRRLTFAWRADDCLYPRAACPAATVATSGLLCTSIPPKDGAGAATLGKDGLCRYHCAQDGTSYVDFPTTIAFTRSPETTRSGDADPATPTSAAPYLKWSIAINTINQQLAGFVAPEERAFAIDTRDWRNPFKDGDGDRYPCDLYFSDKRRRRCEDDRTEADKRRKSKQQPPARSDDADPPPSSRELREAICPGRPRHDDIFYIEFKTGDGSTHRIEIDSVLKCYEQRTATGEARHAHGRAKEPHTPLSAIVKLPRVSCREPVLYRYVGQRDYYEDSVPVENGELRLPHPMEKARYLYFSVALYPASFQWVVSPSALQRRHSGLLYAPTVEGSLVFMPRRAGVRGWRFNLDATFMGAPRPYLPLDDDPDDDPSPRRLLYARGYIGFSFLSPWLGHRKRAHFSGLAAAVGAGVQGGMGFAIQNRDLIRFGGIVHGLVAVRFDLRVRLWKHLEASFSPRLMLAEQSLRYTTDFRGQPRVERLRDMVAVLLPLGVAVVW